MKTLVTVREYARLTTGVIGTDSLDEAHISATAFDWICGQNANIGRSSPVLVHLEDRKSLKLDNYVGVIETPCGTRVEILPKHVDDGDTKESCRNLLRRMIINALDIPVRETGRTDLQTFHLPISEWVVSQFLAALNQLIKRGLRSDYVRIESSEPYLRGQLDVVKQMRRPPGQHDKFSIRHDLFVHDRPENRLLKRALEQAFRETEFSENWRLAAELRNVLHEIPSSLNVREDFKLWRHDRLSAHYQAVKPWCELILARQMPLSLIGGWHGISMLFPMERLFERFVAAALRKVLPFDARLISQAKSKYLCIHDENPIFRLEPDLLIEQGDRRWILDTKWKRVDSKNRAGNYGLNQADFYQLYAYGQKYLSGRGNLALIYPKTDAFQEHLHPFDFGNGLWLSVLPFDLEECRLLHANLLPERPRTLKAA